MKRKHYRHKSQEITICRNLIIITIFFFVMLFFIGVLIGYHPPQPDSPIRYRIQNEVNDDDSPTIFVAMPSVNDPDCNASIISAFENAANPNRIFFGIHQQTNLDKYSDCLDFSSLQCPYHAICSRLWQIQVSRVTDKQAFGPTWGRYMSDKHFDNQTFYLITDSHTFFRKNWDNLMIQIWAQTKNEYAVITHYPKGQNQMEKALRIWESTPSKGSAYHVKEMICGTFWEASINHMPRNANGCYARIYNLKHPVLVPFWAAGFSFCKSHFRNVVPFDPYTKWLFHGEEFYHASRLWTHGYDFYSPQFDVLFHKYANRASRGKMPYSKEIESVRDVSEKRVNYLWNLLDIRTPDISQEQRREIVKDIEKYGLGNKRTMRQFWAFVGCNPILQNITIFETELWSTNGLKRVPWNEPFNIEDPLRDN